MTRSYGLRSVALAAVVAMTLTACSSGAPDDTDDADAVAVQLEAVEQSAKESVPSALVLPLDDPLLPPPLVDPARVVSGGPPPDGIPAVDEPRFHRVDDVPWLAADEPVIALSIGDEHRAYPVQIMVWHEIVNDTIDGTPVTVTYCPLCNSALAFDRRLDERLLTFGTSGRLYLSDLVMYDRQTESLWSQIEGRAIAGELAGEELDRVPVQIVRWSQWRDAHPDGWVLSRETGATRDYGRSPYAGYDQPGSDPFLFDGDVDQRLGPKERVIGLGAPDDPVAVPLALLARERVLDVQTHDARIVLLAGEDVRSALDTADIAQGREIASAGSFLAVLDGRHLSFQPVGPQAFTDEQTGSTWDALGRATDGPLEGSRLQPAGHLDTFWFAWAAFHPETRLITGPG